MICTHCYAEYQDIKTHSCADHCQGCAELRDLVLSKPAAREALKRMAQADEAAGIYDKFTPPE